MERSSSKAVGFWSIVGGVVVLDIITKIWAVRSLVPERIPREVLGDWVRLTLVRNPGAAFGLYLGPYSRWIFIVLTAVALVILGRLYKSTHPGQVLRLAAIGLVCGGAVGNLLDRIHSTRGVVDFLDIGIRDARWPTFNVADIAVSTGALLLAWVLWSEDSAAAEVDAERAAESTPSLPSARPTRDTGT